MSDITKFKDKTEDVPPEFIIEMKGKDKNGKETTTKLIRFGGLLYLLDRIGLYRIQTKDVSTPSVTSETTQTLTENITVDAQGKPLANPVQRITTTVTKNKTPAEIRFEATVYVVPSDEYIESKGISKTSPLYNLLLQPTIAHGTTNDNNTKPNMRQFAYVLAETRAVVRALRFATGCSYTAVDEIGSIKPEDILNYDGPITVQTVAEMLEDSVSKPQTVESALTTRKALIGEVDKLRKTNPVGSQIVADFLDERNKGVVENLDDVALRMLITKLKG